MSRILVAYASKHHSTAEIARFIGDILLENYFEVDVRDVDDIVSLDNYSTVIIGSAVYMGHWLKSAIHFLRQFQVELSTVPVWIFSTGPTGTGDPSDLLDGFIMPENIRSTVNLINPRHVMLFHGEIDPLTLSTGERLMVKAVEAPIGDFRDWNMIRAWANRIVAELHMKVI